MSTSTNRMPLIDALRAVAALLVMFNHFSIYGPMSDTVWDEFPDTFEWFCDYGGMAVQVFLVIGGFLAVRGMSPTGQGHATSPLPLIWKRYLRLVVPYLAAIVLAVAAAAFVDQWIDHDAIPDRPTVTQMLAHVFLLQGVLGFDSLSAGLWYVAIDFQLFAATALVLRLGRVGSALVLLLAVVSLFGFNLNDDWDNWALYFFGSYGLGAAAWWASNPRVKPRWLAVIALVTFGALWLEFRERIAIALVVALLLGLSRPTGFLEGSGHFAPVAFLGKISYSLFLVHFPVLLAANGIYAMLGLSSLASAEVGLMFACVASIGFAALFHGWIEKPSLRLTREARRAA